MGRKTYYLYANPNQPDGMQVVSHVIAMLDHAGAQVLGEKWLCAQQKNVHEATLDVLKHGVDALIAVGGDGTLLRAAPDAAKAHVPMLGIHTGTVGFLMEINASAIDQVIPCLLEGNYCLDERALLACRVDNQEEMLALNDVSLSRGENPGVLALDIFANGEKVYSLTGDGVLISTATGSTAYSLSAGGPIMHPDVKDILVTPLCARELLSRPILLPEKSTVSMRIGAGRHGCAQLSMDGKMICQSIENADITVTSAKEKALFIRFDHRNFFDQLRLKLARWSHF